MIPKKFLPLPWWKRLLWHIKIALYSLVGKGVWILDVEDGALWWNSTNCKVYGLDRPDGLLHNYNSFASMLWADIDREAVTRDVELAQQVGDIYYSAFRAKDQTTGDAIIVQARGWMCKGSGPHAHPRIMIGWNARLPYTQQKEAQIIVRQVAMDKLSRKTGCGGTALMTLFLDHYAHR